MQTAEHRRLAEIQDDTHGWRRWGPYLSERAWATVREDYSPDGNAWEFLPHELARSKAYRWGEDGIAGICDRFQILCFAPAFWNGRDPILKERLFGVTPAQGNHGEDVKEYYFHLDNTPTHSYMRYLYKYPQEAFPYDWLVEENQRRNGEGFEFELLDTGIFEENRYFDIQIEYAKASPEDICIRIEAWNRGPSPADLFVLPHLWFRNTWGWTADRGAEPAIRLGKATSKFQRLIAEPKPGVEQSRLPVSYSLGLQTLYADLGGHPLFTNNETNEARVFGIKGPRTYVKDAFHREVVDGERCTNPNSIGTKAALVYALKQISPGQSATIRLRLSGSSGLGNPLDEVDDIVQLRRREADEFYAAIHALEATDDEKRVQRQAFAGLLWTKQSYLFDVSRWLTGDSPRWPPPESRHEIRNQHWKHLNSMRILSMPDKWEYPWFAAWDLAFHCVALALVDAKFAKDQLWLMLFEQFQHPNGQIPAYEWEFSDLNPPVHAWAVWRVYNMDRIRSGKGDRDFLERCFHKLMINFAWWINKVDSKGNNIFEGGFLGLDNITVVDRSMRCRNGAVLEQADATGWMGMFCLNLMRIALELAHENHAYEGLATKYFQHYTYVAAAMKRMGNRRYQLWDEEDGFFYDVLSYPDGHYEKFRVRSLVGLIPLFAVERLELSWITPFKEFSSQLDWFMRNRPDLVADVVHTVKRADETTHVLTIVNHTQLSRLLQRVWDPSEFLSDFGIRSLSKAHERQPFVFDGRVVRYEPAEAVTKFKGGNSNWRGPIWFPTCFLLIESLRKLAKAYGYDFRIPVPDQPNNTITFTEMAQEIANRLIGIFTRNAAGQRPVYGGTRKFQQDPHWRDLILFHEYFHGDNGAGLGASHQTGWTALVASLIDEWRR